MEIALIIYTAIAVTFFGWSIAGMQDHFLLVFIAALIWPITLGYYVIDNFIVNTDA